MAELFIISCQRNANRFVVNCVESVAQQTLRPRKHIFVDDVSSDDTLQHLEKLRSQYDYLAVIENRERKYRLRNIYEIVSDLDDESIVCLLDGDDWLAYANVLAEVNNQYEEGGYEYVYTNWQFSHAPILGISKKIPDKDWNPYTSPWITSAMATFKAGLFKSIPKANFLDESGEFFKMGTDQAYVLPMLHILRQRDGNYHSVGFIDHPVYVYQFIENELRKRNDEMGNWERQTASVASEVIRERGFLP